MDEPKKLDVGDVVPVLESIWISSRLYGTEFIGHDADATHGHDVTAGCGVLDCKYSLTIRGFEGDKAVVRADRETPPYGSLAAIGSVFLIPTATLEGWDAASLRDNIPKRIKDLRVKYLR